MKIGILGGSGLYDIEGLERVSEREVETPFGLPSDAYVCGRLNEHEVFFLPRHGQGHRLLPSEINHGANICGFKMLGVERVLSISAVGSLKESIRPRDVVLPDQYFDRTKRSSEHTFFGGGAVAHVSFGEPTCAELRQAVARAIRTVIAAEGDAADVRVTVGGTYVCMEGPAFSTKAESYFHRGQGFDVVGMTSLGEAKLCREAEICYQAVAMVTDYDCWHEVEGPVNVEMLVGHLRANTERARRLIREVVRVLPSARGCECGSALKGAILTRPDRIPEEARRRLSPIAGKYLRA